MRKKLSGLLLAAFVLMLCSVPMSMVASADTDPSGNWTDEVALTDDTAETSATDDCSWYTEPHNAEQTSHTIDTPKKLASVAKLVNEGYWKRFTGSDMEWDAYSESEKKTISTQKYIHIYPDFKGIGLVIPTAGLDLSAHYWVPIGTEEHPFRGTIRGEGTEDFPEIKGLHVTTDSAVDGYYGLFGHIDSAQNQEAEINCLNISGDITVTGTENASVGAFAGKITGEDATKLSNLVCAVSITSETTGNVDIGGLAGNADQPSPVQNCTNNGKITVTNAAKANVGGLFGAAKDAVFVTSSTAKTADKGRENESLELGELAAQSCANITVTATDVSNIGGIIGCAEELTLDAAYVGAQSGSMRISAACKDSYVGGVAGNMKSGSISRIEVKNLTIEQKNVTISETEYGGSAVGGVVGLYEEETNTPRNVTILSSMIVNRAKGSVIGGFAGENTGKIENLSTADGLAIKLVTAEDAAVGGLVGKNSGGIMDAVTTSAAITIELATNNDPVKVSGFKIGGLVGINAGTLKNSVRDGDISLNVEAEATSRSVLGGLVGENTSGSIGYGTVEKSYAACSLSVGKLGGVYVGGLIGEMSGGSVKNCYTANKTLTAQAETTHLGGFLGWYSRGSVTNCYSAMEVTGAAPDRAGTFFGCFADENDNSRELPNFKASFFTQKTGGVNSGLKIAASSTQTYREFENTAQKLRAITPEALSECGDIPFREYVGDTWDFENDWRFDEADKEKVGYPYPLLRMPLPASSVTGRMSLNWYTDDPTAKEFHLRTEADLTGFAALVNGYVMGLGKQNFVDKVVYLDNPVSMQTTDWNAIGDRYYETVDVRFAFSGIFDAQNHLISGLRDSAGEVAGLFGYTFTVDTAIERAQIRNVALSVSGVKSTDGAAAGLVACSEGDIEDVTVTLENSAAIAGKTYAGGIAGYLTGSMRSVTLTGADGAAVRGTKYVGGAVGRYAGETALDKNAATAAVQFTGLSVKDVAVSNEEVTAASCLGGLFGALNNAVLTDSELKNVKVTASENTAETDIGGVAGRLTNSIVSGVTAKDSVVSATGCTETVYSGGAVGRLTVSANADQTWRLNADAVLGVYQGLDRMTLDGVAVSADSGIPADATTRYLAGQSGYVGGLVGCLDGGSVYNSTLSGGAAAGKGYESLYVGGAVGQAKNTAYQVNNTVDCGVTAENAMHLYAGGFAGELMSSTVRYNSVEAKNDNRLTVTENVGVSDVPYLYAGGFAGNILGTLTDQLRDNAARVDVDVSNDHLYTTIYAGGFAGLVGRDENAVRLTACMAESDLSVSSDREGVPAGDTAYVGGFIGQLYTGTVESCYALSSVNENLCCTAKSGGFAGLIHQGAVAQDCYAVGDKVSVNGNSSYCGGFVGDCEGKLSRAYASVAELEKKDKSSPANKGEIMGAVREFSDVTDVFYKDLKDNTALLEYLDFTTENSKWAYQKDVNGNRPVLTAFASWDSDPVIEYLYQHAPNELTVTDTAELGTAIALLNDSSIYALFSDGREEAETYLVSLTADLSLKSDDVWKLNIPANAIFDGQGHTLSDLCCELPDAKACGFVLENAGTLKNLTLAGAKVTGGAAAGTAVGENKGTVENVIVLNPKVTANDYAARSGCVGLAVGRNAGEITRSATFGDCYFAADAAATDRLTLGGIVGDNSGTVKECLNAANLQMSGCVMKLGGIAGECTGTISDCMTASGSTVSGVYGTTATGGFVGGIVGVLKPAGKVQDCISLSQVILLNKDGEAANYAGAVAGKAESGATVDSVYYDKCISRVNNYNGGGSEKTTADMLGVKAVDKATFTAQENLYPILTWLESTDIGKLSNAAFNLADGETIKTIATPFSITAAEGVAVNKNEKTSISGGKVTLSAKNGSILLSLDDLSRTVRLSNLNYEAMPGGGGDGAPAITVPVSGDGNTVRASAAVSGSTAVVEEIKDDLLAKVVGDESVLIDLTGLSKTIDTAELPVGTMKKIGEQSGASIKLTIATVAFDTAATQETAAQAQGSGIKLAVSYIGEGDLNAKQREALKMLDTVLALDTYLASGNVRICTEDKGGFGGGKATVTLPYTLRLGSTPAQYSVYYVAEDGRLEKLNAWYDTGASAFVFNITHFSNYVVVFDKNGGSEACLRDNTCPLARFADVKTGEWYHDGIHYCLDNGIMNGLSKTAFAPNKATTRAMIVTMLARLSGYTVNGVGSEWYLPGMEWAVANGVSDGTNMTANITREQLATMLYRYAVEIAKVDVDKFTADTNTLSYDDVFTVSDWAAEGVHFCLAAGIIGGYENGTIRPQAEASRAEVAAMFMRFCVNILGR